MDYTDILLLEFQERRPMDKGKWYLEYEFTYMEVSFGDVDVDTIKAKIPLDATTEADAIAEAKTKWEEKKKENSSAKYPRIVYKYEVSMQTA